MATCTALPPIALRSAGEGLQESLDHYMCRLLSALCVSRKDLALKLWGGTSRAESSLLGPRGHFFEMIPELERQTGIADLRRGSFYAVHGVMGQSGLTGKTSTARRWCPTCYQQWDNEIGYEPLLWSFEALAACPMHGCRLICECSRCGREQQHTAYASRRECRQCREPLGYNAEPESLTPVEAWIDHALRDFTAWLDGTPEAAQLDDFDHFLAMRRHMKSEKVAHDRHIAKWYSIRTSGRSLLSISQLLNLAAIQGVSIPVLLTDPVTAASGQLFPDSVPFQGLPIRRRETREDIARTGFVMCVMLEQTNHLLPPRRTLWKLGKLWGHVLRERYEMEYYAYHDRFIREKRPVPEYRFKGLIEFAVGRFLEHDASNEVVIDEMISEFVISSDVAMICIATARGMVDAWRRSQDELLVQKFHADRGMTQRHLLCEGRSA